MKVASTVRVFPLSRWRLQVTASRYCNLGDLMLTPALSVQGFSWKHRYWSACLGFLKWAVRVELHRAHLPT